MSRIVLSRRAERDLRRVGRGEALARLREALEGRRLRPGPLVSARQLDLGAGSEAEQLDLGRGPESGLLAAARRSVGTRSWLASSCLSCPWIRKGLWQDAPVAIAD